MSRSSKKGVYIEEKLYEKAKKAKDKGDRRPIKTWSRRSTVTPELVGLTFAVHNGKSFTNIFVTENMVGHRLGEFSPTRTFRKHSGSKAEAAAAGAAAPAADAKPAGDKAKPAAKG